MTSDRCRCQRVDVIVMLWNTGVGNPISIEMKFMSKTTGNVTTTTHAQMSCPGAGLPFVLIASLMQLFIY